MSRRAASWTLYLRRRTTTGHWLPEIDGLRFIAIASVLLFHIQGQFEHNYAFAVPHTGSVRMLDFGKRGVPLFFVLSGFILSLPFARSRMSNTPAPSLRNYYLRRLTRLEPPYLLNLALVTLGATLLDHQVWRALLPHLAASAAYLHYAVFRTPSTINSVAWSLEVEVQFYVLAPLLTFIFTVRNILARRALLIAALTASASLQLFFHLSQFTLAGDLPYFLAGLLLADLYLARTKASASAALTDRPFWDLAALLGWPAFFLLPDKFTSLWLPVLALLLCLAAFRGAITSRILRTPAIAITGGMCYTIYLWHAPVLTAVDRLLRAHAPTLALLSYPQLFILEASLKLIAVIVICLPLFILIERPCMDPKWPQKLISKLRKWPPHVPLPSPEGLGQANR